VNSSKAAHGRYSSSERIHLQLYDFKRMRFPVSADLLLEVSGTRPLWDYRAFWSSHPLRRATSASQLSLTVNGKRHSESTSPVPGMQEKLMVRDLYENVGGD